ncbi:hypothetical protein SAMN02745150_00554 [Brevinema andersonii]|uniref:Uncharacterized protein n=1 Tax=Brevinema andersonii TaxID=34097 RepID=A0A1I1DJ95_BREAD|nr:hypothetical protein [Brevinema andersonii]SFB74516.1 hypothetical protein SAMN02745150_00554 [Brevinema andersonii]
MGAQTPWVQLNTPNGYYIEDNTEIWNVDSDVMEATIMRMSTSGNTTTTNANRFPITMENDVYSSEGGFKLGTPMKVYNGTGLDFPELTTPKYENCYFYAVTGTGPKSDEARITNSPNSVADPKQKLPLHLNFHTLENSPLSYAVIGNIYKNAKDKSHTYIQY